MQAMDIATVIRTARRKAGLSQRVVAAKLKVQPSAVAQWETGDTKPTISHRVEIATLLNIKFSDLLSEVADGPLSLDDPETVRFVRLFEKLPASVREALLMQAAATAELLEAQQPPPAPKS